MAVLLTILFAGVAIMATAATIRALVRLGPVLRELRSAVNEAPETRTVRLVVQAQGRMTPVKRKRRPSRPKRLTHRLHRGTLRAA